MDVINIDKKIAGSVIRSCICKHDFQDKTYGKQQRVKNMCVKGYRCTVCGSLDETSSFKK
jgi:hypothetical protein